MRAFLLQVAKSGEIAESGLKVIAYFDALVEHRATLEACVRAAAALSQCVAGLRDAGSAVSVRFNRRGLTVEGASTPTTSRPVRIGERDVGEVWLEREDGPALLDELIVERLALAAGVLWRGSPRPGRSTAHLIELVLSTGAAPEARIDALERLGMSAEQPLDVAAVGAAEPDRLAAGLARVHRAVREQHPAGRRSAVCWAVLGGVAAVLAQPGLTGDDETTGDRVPLPGLEAGFVAGTARGRPAECVTDAWQQAQTAMRFCGLLGFGNVVDHDDLGSLTILAQLPQSVIESNPDVRAVAELTRTSRGTAVLDTLQQRLASGSVRETATALYLHHSSVRYRLRKAEESLGLALENPRSRLRVELALLLWRLSSR
jgi:hypothetical protein